MWVSMSQRGHRREAMGRGGKRDGEGLVLCVQDLKDRARKKEEGRGMDVQKKSFRGN